MELSQGTHERAALLFTKFLFYHDAGENYWRIGEIHLLRGDFAAAQDVFDKVQKSFDHVAQLVPTLAGAYSAFSTFGTTFVGLVDGLHLVARGEYRQAVALFEDLAGGLADETERTLRRLRQLLEVLSAACQYAATLKSAQADAARTQLARLSGALSSDAYELQLPYGLHATVRRLQEFLDKPTSIFPPVLMDLPIHENIMAIAQTRYLVSAAMNLYQAAAEERETTAEEPNEEAIRSYIARISSIVGSR
jgi:tetratricopeptide (TPR) repeat protein